MVRVRPEFDSLSGLQFDTSPLLLADCHKKEVILLDQNQTSPVQCSGCHAVTTNDGKTVWVCENCGVENTVVTEPAVAAVQADVAAAAAQVTPVAPVVEEKPAV